MARELSNATDPIDEMSGLIDVLARPVSGPGMTS